MTVCILILSFFIILFCKYHARHQNQRKPFFLIFKLVVKMSKATIFIDNAHLHKRTSMAECLLYSSKSRLLLIGKLSRGLYFCQTSHTLKDFKNAKIEIRKINNFLMYQFY